jgi:alpha-D-ribose 1-methylphosphonate 5-triphosphate synthase subunit PhnG
MSQTIQAESKPNKVQTTLTYKQTKLNLSRPSIKQTSETKRGYSYTKSCQHSKSKQAAGNERKQTECIASKQDVVSEVPAIVTLPEIRRVLGEEGVTKIVVDLETSSRGTVGSLGFIVGYIQ